MKINQPKLQSAYLAKINKICENCEDKSHFSIPEIVSIIADLIDTGEFYIAGFRLYAEKEINDETTNAYNRGYNDGSNHYYGEDCPNQQP